jgi:hypothetical protein
MDFLFSPYVAIKVADSKVQFVEHDRERITAIEIPVQLFLQGVIYSIAVD